MRSNSKSNQEIIFSGETSSIIQDLLKKYKLESVQKEKMNEMAQVKTFQEKRKIFEDLPGRKIAKIVKGVAREKIPLENFSLRLQKLLSVDQAIAKKLAKDLQEKVLILAKTVTIKEIEEISPKIPLSGVVKPPPSRTEVTKEKLPKIEPESSPEKPIIKKPDVYREPIE